jgi:BMFP domain-containing protein YqiC
VCEDARDVLDALAVRVEQLELARDHRLAILEGRIAVLEAELTELQTVVEQKVDP